MLTNAVNAAAMENGTDEIAFAIQRGEVEVVRSWLDNGGDDVYACWKLSYHEDFFLDEALRGYATWQDYHQPGLCPVAEYLQRMMARPGWRNAQREQDAAMAEQGVVEDEA